MKRTKFLALVLAVAVMLMGAGYAIWTDAITINNTVNTGHVNVTVQNGTIAFDELVTGSAVVDTIDATNHTAAVTLNNLYPGAVNTITIPYTNNSTIPVKFSAAPIVGAVDNLALRPYISVTDITYNTGNINPLETGTITFKVNVSKDAPNDTTEDATAHFTMTANFEQWK